MSRRNARLSLLAAATVLTAAAVFLLSRTAERAGPPSSAPAPSSDAPAPAPEAAAPIGAPAEAPAAAPEPAAPAAAPDPEWDAEAFRDWLRSPWPEYAGGAEEKDETADEPKDYDGDAPPELSDLLDGLSPRAAFARHLAELEAADGAQPEALGRRLLSFDDPTLRALGGALLLDAGALDPEAVAALVADPDPFVPLLVGQRAADYFGPEAAAPLADGLRARGFSADALLAAAASPAGRQGGGRLAVELLMEGRDAAGRLALGMSVARDEALPYDVRMDAVLRIADESPAEEALARIGELLGEAGDPGEDLWAEALLRESERLGRNLPLDDDLAPRPDEPDAPAEGVASPAVGGDGGLTLEELGWFLSDANETGPEDAALRLARWLSAAGADAPAEPGCADAVLAFADEFPERQFSPLPEAEEPLARLRALAGRVRAREQGPVR